MREWCQISARTDASLLRDRWIETRVEHASQEIDQQRASAGISLSDDICAKQHHRARFRLAQQRPDADRVRSDQVDLQFRKSIWRDRDIGKLAKSSRDAVHDFVALDDACDDRVGCSHRYARLVTQFNSGAASSDRYDIFDAQRPSIKFYHFRIGAHTSARRSTNPVRNVSIA